MMRLGPVVLVAVLQIPPASIYDDDETRTDCLGSSAPDTASDDDKTLGPVYELAVLLILPTVTGAGFLGSSASDTASDAETLGPVYVEAVLPISPVVTRAGVRGNSAPDFASCYWGRFSW